MSDARKKAILKEISICAALSILPLGTILIAIRLFTKYKEKDNATNGTRRHPRRDEVTR